MASRNQYGNNNNGLLNKIWANKVEIGAGMATGLALRLAFGAAAVAMLSPVVPAIAVPVALGAGIGCLVGVVREAGWGKKNPNEAWVSRYVKAGVKGLGAGAAGGALFEGLAYVWDTQVIQDTLSNFANAAKSLFASTPPATSIAFNQSTGVAEVAGIPAERMCWNGHVFNSWSDSHLLTLSPPPTGPYNLLDQANSNLFKELPYYYHSFLLDSLEHTSPLDPSHSSNLNGVLNGVKYQSGVACPTCPDFTVDISEPFKKNLTGVANILVKNVSTAVHFNNGVPDCTPLKGTVEGLCPCGAAIAPAP